MKKQSITFAEYEKEAKSTDLGKDKNEIHFAFIGLMGEIGELLTIFKKDVRGDIGNNKTVCTELGDILWYFLKICRKRNIKFHELVKCKKNECIDVIIEKFEDERKLVFINTSQFSIDISVLVGTLATALQNDNKIKIKNTLYKILVLIVTASCRYQLSLSQIAIFNIDKIKDRFRTDFPRKYNKALDDDFPILERFPRKIELEIREKNINGEIKVVVCKGDRIYGNPLDDNISGIADDYRYHDIFHIAFATHLGWSPNLRALLQLKRKSKKSVDRNEDGARARFVEEGIVHLVFKYGEENNFFEHNPDARVTSLILDIIEMMVKGFEVDVKPLSFWNDAIKDSFEIFREVRKHRTGLIKIDMNLRTIKFKP